jgi:DnaJ-class molecular chaperone
MTRRQAFPYRRRICDSIMLVNDRRTGDTVTALIVLLLIAIVIGGYAASLKLNPWVKCSKCHGKQRAQGWVFSNTHHNCPKCGGTGRQVRLGRKLFRMGSGEGSS